MAAPSNQANALVVEPSIDERYQVLETLAAGRFESMYLAQRRDTRARVVLRVWSDDLPENEALEQALREHVARVATAAKDCPGLATVYECGRTNSGTLFMSMEHPDGSPLSDALRRQCPLPAAHALRLAVRIAEALEAAHSFGLVHGSLKPQNVFLVGGGRDVKVTHYGLDRLDASIGIGTRARDRAGGRVSPYRSPEQARSGQVTEQSDIYSLGAILYEMLAGVPPPAASGRRVEREPLTASRRNITPELERVVMRALEALPHQRYQDMYSFLKELQAELGAAEAALRWGRRWKYGGLGVTLAMISVLIWFHPFRAASQIALPEGLRSLPQSLRSLPQNLPSLPESLRALPQSLLSLRESLRAPASPPVLVAPDAVESPSAAPRPGAPDEVPPGPSADDGPAPPLVEPKRASEAAASTKTEQDDARRETPVASDPPRANASRAGRDLELPPRLRHEEAIRPPRPVPTPPTAPIATQAPAHRERIVGPGFIIDRPLDAPGSPPN